MSPYRSVIPCVRLTTRTRPCHLTEVSSLVWGWLPDHVTLPKCHPLCEVDYQTMSPYRSVIPCVRLTTRPCHLTEVSSLVWGWLPDYVTLPKCHPLCEVDYQTMSPYRSVIPCVRLTTRPCHLTEVSSLVWGWLPDYVTLAECHPLCEVDYQNQTMSPYRSVIPCVRLTTRPCLLTEVSSLVWGWLPDHVTLLKCHPLCEVDYQNQTMSHYRSVIPCVRLTTRPCHLTEVSSLVWGWLPDYVTLPKCHPLCEVDYQTMSPYRSVIPCARLTTRLCHLTEVSSLVWGWLPDHVTLPKCRPWCEVDYQTMSPYPKCHRLCEVDYQTMSPYRSVIPCVRLTTRPCHLTEVSSLMRGWLPDHVTLPKCHPLCEVDHQTMSPNTKCHPLCEVDYQTMSP